MSKQIKTNSRPDPDTAIKENLRVASFMTFALALLAPVGWAWAQLSWFKEQHPDFSCGLPVLAIYAFAVCGAGVLSLVATSLNVVAFRRLSRPRSFGRKVEIAAISMPAIIATVMIFGVWYAG